MTSYTPNYDLELYDETDKPNLLDQYNASMRILDGAVQSVHGDAAIAVAAANQAKTIAEGVEGKADAAETAANAATTAANAASAKAGNVSTELQNLSDSLGSAAFLDTTNDVSVANLNPITSKGVYDALQGYTPGGGDRPRKIVLAGDSYVKDTATPPSRDFGIGQSLITLYPEWTFYNYADGGSGFTFGGHQGRTFQQQIQAAASDTSIVNDDVTDVVIIGGRNEAGGENSDGTIAASLGGAVRSCVNAASSSFPNATVWVFPVVYDWKIPNFNVKRVLDTIEENAIYTGAKVAKGCWSWGTGQTALYVSMSDIHPNQNGCDTFARYIHDAIENNQLMTGISRSEYIDMSGTGGGLSRGLISMNGNNMTAEIVSEKTGVYLPAAGTDRVVIAENFLPSWFKYPNKATMGDGWVFGSISPLEGGNFETNHFNYIDPTIGIQSYAAATVATHGKTASLFPFYTE